MTTYPAHILCPSCGGVACNYTVGLEKIFALLALDHGHLDRQLVRTDAGKAGPSHHLLVCQHCDFTFKPMLKRIIEQPRTV